MDRAPVARLESADFADLPLSDVLQINALADKFEAAWRCGGDPQVANYRNLLRTSSAAARDVLCRHLAQLEVELDSQRPTPRGNAYEKRQHATHASSQALKRDTPCERIPQEQLRLELDESVSDQSIAVGEYLILERLGSGGMGIVYKALHRRLDRVVAIKFPRLLAQFDPLAVARFVREARLIGQLAHPHIVQALDAGDSDYGPYLVTEFIEGETIESLVRREGPISIESAMSFAAQAAGALGYAHSRGIIHRDIKPSNLYLGTDRLLRVLDFGLAKLQCDGRSIGEVPQQSNQTQAGDFVGTVGYAAPEQLSGTDGVDHRADIYSLGCVFFFLLTGEQPHKGSLGDRLLASHKEIGTSLRRRRQDIPPSVEAIWRRMVASDPGRRIKSMAEIETTMRLAPPTDGEPARCSFRTARSLLRRTSWAFAIATLAACAIAAATFAPSARRGNPATPPPPVAIAPFDDLEAQRHQQRWAEHLGTAARKSNSLGMPMVLIPAGEYVMGTSHDPIPDIPPTSLERRRPDLVAAQRPQHRVVLTNPFYLGQTEVTVGQFRRFTAEAGYVTEAENQIGWGMENGHWVERKGYSWKNLGEWRTDDDYPVNNVNWNDVAAFCDWLTSRSSEGTYRLPTEAEWEFACRAGSTTTFYFGNNPDKLAEHAWFESNSRGVYWPVALKKPNPFGLYDMYGNRREWCLDNYSSDYYALSPALDPLNDSGGRDRVMRGGTHASPAAFATSASRWAQFSSYTNYAGFRVVLEIR